MSQPEYGIDAKYQIPDALWEVIAGLLPPPKAKKKAGRPRMADRQAMTAIFYILRTGCQWKALPRSLGADSTVHDRFQAGRAAGVFEALWVAGLEHYAAVKGIEWEWQALDGAMTKAPLGGKTHRAESDGPRQRRHQTESADRRARCAHRLGGGRREPP